MGAKLKSKTHLLNTFLIFWDFFLMFGFKVFKKCLYDKKIVLKKSKKISKNTEFLADFKSVEKLLQNATKKVISKTTLMNMSKSENNTYFCHVLAHNFFGAFFQNFFNGFKISVKFCIFFTHIEFLKKIWWQMRTKWLKNWKSIFMNVS